MKLQLYQFLLYLFLFIQLILAHGIHHHDGEEEEEEGHDHDHDHEDHDHEKEYPIGYTLIGIAAVLVCSFLGTILPIIFKNKSYFHENTLLFNSVKLFGTGIILSVAFIHMIIPAGQILSSEYTYKIFYEGYTSFTGVFVILGIILTHVIQVYTSHFLTKNSDSHEHSHENEIDHNSKSSDITIDVNDEKKKMEGDDITNIKNVWHKKNSKTEVVPAVDGCVEEQHGLLHLIENKEKQVISYLLEIGISIHSILIGIAFGMTRDSELIILMIALMFHQFFEGVSLSSVFIEAHFKRNRAIIVMIIVYSLTLPIGAFIGVIIRNAIESTDRVYLTVQGIIDAVAGGILIYDDLVNILSRHCNSTVFKKSSISKKNVQLIAFYCGIAVMAVIGIWA